MLCLNPILALSICKNADDKHVLKFVSRKDIYRIEDLKKVYGADEVFLLPCMKCDSCRSNYAKQWALRCYLEAQMHTYNYFITLTYNDIYVKYGCKKDFSNYFLKKLGYRLTGKRDRPLFFACQERGEVTNRLHFHAVLFLDHELKLMDPVKKGDFYHYHSEEISSCWKFGLHDITPFEHDCAAYVAKYSTKQGNCFMSKNLGKSYYLSHKKEIIEDNFKVYVDFNKSNFVDIPKSFVDYFVKDAVADVDGFKLKKKELNRLLSIREINYVYAGSESVVLVDKILAFIKHNEYKVGRSEL